MTFWHYIYGISGFVLVLWLLLEDDTPIPNAIFMSLLIGPFVGVPFFVIMVGCFGNWPVIVRDVWAMLCWPVRAYRKRKTGGEQCES